MAEEEEGAADGLTCPHQRLLDGDPVQLDTLKHVSGRTGQRWNPELFVDRNHQCLKFFICWKKKLDNGKVEKLHRNNSFWTGFIKGSWSFISASQTVFLKHKLCLFLTTERWIFKYSIKNDISLDVNQTH
ncbi:hypothetical protein XENORESO_022163 [Xenotaenia resolanae]|uniref:Uncharacterized protein n=1 Tax=Xenotaenia resolanae TaxID=208358 RepID=A0ABV0VY48_9TELE